jgi:D-alanyl-D-alanine carboxypeptidase
VSKVEDLMKLGRYVYQHEPEMYDITRVRQYSILKHTWVNQNRFLNYDTFLGGKNGYIDESKKTTVSLFNVPMARGGNRAVIIVILRSDDREGDAVKIMNFLKRNAYFDPAQA